MMKKTFYKDEKSTVKSKETAACGLAEEPARKRFQNRATRRVHPAGTSPAASRSGLETVS
jgi:hypothetical protein